MPATTEEIEKALGIARRSVAYHYRGLKPADMKDVLQHVSVYLLFHALPAYKPPTALGHYFSACALKETATFLKEEGRRGFSSDKRSPEGYPTRARGRTIKLKVVSFQDEVGEDEDGTAVLREDLIGDKPVGELEDKLVDDIHK